MGKEQDFVEGFEHMQVLVHALAREKGWYDQDRNTAEQLMLCVTELAEATEYLRRKLRPPEEGVVSLGRHNYIESDHLPGFAGVEEELADVVIRLMDLAESMGWRLAEAICAKHEFNTTRPTRHGKIF